MKILHLEDNPHDIELVRELLRADGIDCTIHAVSGRTAYEAALRAAAPDVIVSDYTLPGFDGMDALVLARSLLPDTPFIFCSGSIGEDRAIAALRAGANDYVIKDRMQRLATALLRAVGDAKERRVRREAQRQLEASQRRYQRLVDAACDAIFSLSTAGRITSLNPAFTLITGWPREPWLGRHFTELVHPEDLPFASERFDRVVIINETPRPFELRIRTAAGGTVILEFSVTLNRTEGGDTEVLGIGRDITTRREDERVIREQAEVIERSPIAVIITDLAHRVTYCNEGARRLYGLSSSELLGATAEAVFPPETARRIADGRAATLADGQWHGEVPVTTRDGRRLVVEFFMNLIRAADGSPLARLSVGLDVTEKKQLEEQFLRSQRMENLGLLAAGIAHDFNNILAPILMAANLFRLRPSSTGDERMLVLLEQNAERGAALVRQILAFAHGTSGEPHLLQIKHLARDIAHLIEETFPRSLEFEPVFANDLWPVQGNPTQLHQVLLNLCVNARDAMPAGGTLRLRAANLRLDAAAAAAIPHGRPGAFVLLEVSDTGGGIPPEIIERIWEPFFTTKGPDKGTGLGLATVRGIVTQHNGFCTVESTPGAGTTFRIYLPAVEAETPPETGAATTPPLPRGRGETILVVDDEAQVLDFIGATLTAYGYRPVLAHDGLQAVTQLEAHAGRIALAIVDLMMPHCDGESFIRILRQRDPAARIVVISGGEPAGGGTALPGDTFLAKPFKPDVLLTEVNRLLRANRAE